MNIDAAVRWQIDPSRRRASIHEIGGHEQIESVVQNAIRNGVRDGMSPFSINQISDRQHDRRPDAGRGRLRARDAGRAPVARHSHRRDHGLLPAGTCSRRNRSCRPSTRRSRRNSKWRRNAIVSMWRGSRRSSSGLLNQTLTPEALTKQYLEVLEGMKTSSNLVILVPTEGGVRC
jgi:hypothetical protein